MEKQNKRNFLKTFLGTIIFSVSNSPSMILLVLSVYITSYIHLKQKFVTMHYGTFFGPISQISMTIVGPIAGILDEKIGFHKTLILGSSIIFISLIGIYNQQNIYIFYILLALKGIGTGICLPLPGKNLIMYVPGKKGFISSTLMIPNILLATFFGFLGEKIINRNGYTLNPKIGEQFYPEYICINIKKYFIICILVFPIGRIISLFLIKKYKTNSNNIKQNDIKKLENSSIEITTTTENSQRENNSVKKALKNRRYWLIVGITFFASFSQHFIMGTSRTFGALIGINGTILQYLGIARSLSLIIISPIFGLLVDKIGSKYILTGITLLSSLISLNFAIFINETYAFIILNILECIVFSGFITAMNPHMMHVFGIKNSVILGGVNGIFSTISSIIVSFIAFGISRFYKTELLKIPYRICFFVISLFDFFSFILTFFDSDKPFNYEIDYQEISIKINNLNKGKFNKNSYVELEEK